jgi:hypothetical protein
MLMEPTRTRILKDFLYQISIKKVEDKGNLIRDFL